MSFQNSRLFRNFAGSEEIRTLFSASRKVAHFLRVKVALAAVEASLGIIPASAHAEIARRAEGLEVNWPRLDREVAAGGHPALPLVRQLADACGGAAEYLHWGSAARDILDIAYALQLRDAIEVVVRDAAHLQGVLEGLAKSHLSTVMMPRSGGTNALPTTFGFRCGAWAEELGRHLERLSCIRSGVVAGRFRASVGELSPLGPRANEILEGLMRELGLAASPNAGFALRDHLRDVVFTLATLASSLAYIATTLVAMAGTDVQEIRAPFAEPDDDRCILSSACAVIFSNAGAAVENVTLAMDSALRPFARERQDHLEDELVPQTFLLVHESVTRMDAMLGCLEIAPDRMQGNIERTRGLVMAEIVMQRLAGKAGRRTAHRLMTRVCDAALRDDLPLRKVLLDSREVTALMSSDELDAALDPATALGPQRG